ncbi:MAG: flavodoxin [Clostridia bacterium]|nr:flavodoxin [Clostridia bacterium]
MTIAIRYDSKTGNTKKLADAIAQAVGAPACLVDQPLTEKADVLFLGSSVYAAGASEEIKRFIAGLDAGKVGAVACFSTAALLPSTYGQVSRLLKEKGIRVLQDEFHCRGQFHFMHKGKPDEEDLKAAAAFARRVTGDRQ